MPRTPSPWTRLRGPVVAGVGLALMATGCSTTAGPRLGGGPGGANTAAPAKLVPQGAAAPAQSSRPNIVTIVTDDMRTDDLRWMPNVRALVQGQGLDFRNSFASYPLCAPARATLMSGQYAHNTGVLAVAPPNNYQAFDDRRTVATSLNAAGYNTLFLGKYMNGYGTDRSKVTGKNSFRYVPPGWTDWMGSVSRPVNSQLKGGTYNYFHLLLNHNGTIDDTHQGVYQSVVEGRLTRRLVRTYHRSPKPFFLYFAPIAPHFGAPREKGDPHGLVWPGTGQPERIKTPARPGRVWGKFNRQITRASGLPADGSESQKDVSKLPRPMRWLPPIVAKEKAAMLSLTRQRAEALFVLDQQIGKLVQTLKKTGEYDNTVLMFTSDNGYFLGEHRMRQGKVWAHEPSLRVPFLVAGRGVPHGVRYDPVTSADVTATILDLGGARPPHPADGRSLVPSFARDRGWRAPVVVEGQEDGAEMSAAEDHRPPGFDTPLTGTGVRTPRWKYVRYVDGDAELYDLTHDPNELHNLYGLKRYAGVQARLAQLWRRYRSCAGILCQAPMPAAMQEGPRQLAQSTQQQERGVAARYGVPLP